MQALDNPTAPPHCCHVCKRTPLSKQPTRWVDTGKNFGLNFPRNIPMKGRIYICEPCAEEIGKAIGLVSLSLVERARAEVRRARATANVFRSRFERLTAEVTEGDLEDEASFISQADALDAELSAALGDETETPATTETEQAPGAEGDEDS